MKKAGIFLLILVVIVGMLTACGEKAEQGASADTPTEQATAAAFAVTDAVRAELAEEFETVFTQRLYEGAAYVLYGGEELYSGGVSKADKTTGVDNSADVVYRIASVSKQFTAAAILKLCEEGKLSLDDTLSPYFPDYTIGKDITIRDLLTMQSGIPDFVRSYDENGYEVDSASAFVSGVDRDNTAEENQSAMLKHIYAKELLYTPGERYSYSNANYLLLGLIVGQVSGTNCHDYIRTNFFEPLGMETAGFLDEDDNPDAVAAQGYHRANAAELIIYPGCSFGCADIIASPKDLYKWTIGLHSGKVLNNAMYQEMITGVADIGNGSRYGCGLMITQSDGMTVYYHPGSLPGFITFVGYIPEKDFYIALMSNYGCENTPLVANKLTRIVAEKVAGTE